MIKHFRIHFPAQIKQDAKEKTKISSAHSVCVCLCVGMKERVSIHTWKIKCVYCSACACSNIPSLARVRKASPRYQGVLMVTSFFRSHKSALLPRKRWGWGITVEEVWSCDQSAQLLHRHFESELSGLIVYHPWSELDNCFCHSTRWVCFGNRRHNVSPHAALRREKSEYLIPDAHEV